MAGMPRYKAISPSKSRKPVQERTKYVGLIVLFLVTVAVVVFAAALR